MDRSGSKTCGRRDLLRAGGTLAGVGVLGGLSGCQVPFVGGNGGDGGSDAGRDPLGVVPSDAAAVLDADVAAVLGDATLRDAVNARLSERSDAGIPGSVSAAIGRMTDRIGLDPRDIEAVIGYATGVDRDARGGTVAWTDWAADDVRAAVDSADAEVTETSYAGVTVYEYSALPEVAWLADLGEGLLAAGPAAQVRSVVDVSHGDAEPVEGDTVDAFRAADPGYVRLGVDIPSERLEAELENAIVGSETAADLQYGFGRLAANGSSRSIVGGVECRSSSSAENVEGLANAGLATARIELRNRDPEGDEAVLLEALENTTVSVDGGTTVTVRYEASADAFADAVGAGVGQALANLDAFPSVPTSFASE